MMESLPGLKNKKIEKRPTSLWNICNKMGEWFNFAALGMDGIGIKSDRQLIRDIHESSRLFSQKPDHLTLDIDSIQYLKQHHPALYTQRRL